MKKKRLFRAMFILNNDRFTKTGSGQTLGKSTKEKCVFLYRDIALELAEVLGVGDGGGGGGGESSGEGGGGAAPPPIEAADAGGSGGGGGGDR
eukprot:COSAG06_NODE_16583_length_992_cov_3.008959_2_plen_93_part_00